MRRFKKSLKIKRTAAGSYVNGEWVNGQVTDVFMKAIVQPMGIDRLLNEDEGRRLKGAIKIYSDEPLVVGKGEQVADYVEYNGDYYEVVASQTYKEIKSHTKSEAVLFADGVSFE